eukprot:Platyproteum_vivax@DN6716_c0_g1_i2.p1
MSSELITDAFNEVGWDAKPDETPEASHLNRILRSCLVRMSSTYSLDAAFIAEAKARFHKWVQSGFDDSVAQLPDDYKPAVYKIVLKSGAEPEWNQIKNFFQNFETDEQKRKILFTLGSTPVKALKQKTLEWSISGDVKPQDLFYLMASVSSSNDEGSNMAFQFFKDNFDKIFGIYDSASPSLLSGVVGCCCRCLTDQKQVDDATKFFADHPLPLIKPKLDQLLEALNINVDFSNRLIASAKKSKK